MTTAVSFSNVSSWSHVTSTDWKRRGTFTVIQLTHNITGIKKWHTIRKAVHLITCLHFLQKAVRQTNFKQTLLKYRIYLEAKNCTSKISWKDGAFPAWHATEFSNKIQLLTLSTISFISDLIQDSILIRLTWSKQSNDNTDEQKQFFLSANKSWLTVYVRMLHPLYMCVTTVGLADGGFTIKINIQHSDGMFGKQNLS